MLLYVIRHAQAEASGPGVPDADRPLTPQGREDFRRSVAELRRLGVATLRVLTSPLVRAQETAAILEAELPTPPVRVCEALSPQSSLENLVSVLAEEVFSMPLAVIGHQPTLGQLLALLTRGTSRSGFPLATGGVARLSFEGALGPGRGVLEWLLIGQELRIPLPPP